MKIIACECPCCGSNLDINSDTEFLKCDYCGANLYVEKVIKPVGKKEKSDNEKNIEYMSFYDKLRSTCTEFIKRIKEMDITVSENTTLFPNAFGSMKVSFFTSKIYDDEYFPYTFNNVSIDPYSFIKNSNYIEDEYISYTPEKRKYYSEKTHEQLYKRYVIYNSLTDEQKDVIKNYLYYLSMLDKYSALLNGYMYMTQMIKKVENGKPLEGYWNYSKGPFTISEVIKKRDNLEIEILNFQVELLNNEVNEYSDSKSNTK